MVLQLSSLFPIIGVFINTVSRVNPRYLYAHMQGRARKQAQVLQACAFLSRRERH